MPKTKEASLAEKVEDARAEHLSTRKRIDELQAELAGIPSKIAGVDWSDEEKAVLEVAALERRRDALPHYLKHLRRTAIEQEISVLNLETEEAESRRPELNERVEKLQGEFERARAALNEAKGEQHELVYGTLSDIRRGISEAEKRLRALENEPTEGIAPVVRSVWQQNMSSPGPEDAIQDTPGSHRFGSANVADKPASVGTPDNVVIPQRAKGGGGA